jgi:RNA polymerase sigma factor (sigma-70 family)
MQDADAVVKKFRRLVYGITNRFYPLLEATYFEIEDLAQEGFLAIIEALPNFDESKNNRLMTFLYPVVFNRIYKKINRERRRFIKTALIDKSHSSAVCDIEDLSYDELIADPYAEDSFRDVETKILCDKIKSKLTKRQRQILELLFERELDHREVAKYIRTSRQNVYDAMKKARRVAAYLMDKKDNKEEAS